MSAPISPPIGGKKRGRPKKPDSLAVLAKSFKISVRSLERAVFIRGHGIPELEAMVQGGDLPLGPAEIIARLPHDLQRACVSGGASQARFIAKVMRRESLRVRP